MTKQGSAKQASLKAAEDIRFKSILQLKNDFVNSSKPKTGKDYDLRTYNSGGEMYYPYMFAKTLEHDTTTGFVKKVDVDRILDALNEGTTDKVNAIQLSTVSQKKLEGILCSSSFNLIGTDPLLLDTSNFYAVDSEAGAFEMAEVYAKAILRDIPFSEYDSNSNVNTIRSALNEYSDFTTAPLDNGSISSKFLFRGSGVDETVGPYISQLLYKDFNYGSMTIQQKYKPETDYVSSLTKSEWLEIQNGKVNGSVSQSSEQYAYNGRVLGSMVHSDPLYQFYYNASMILLQNGVTPSAFTTNTSTAWTSGGGPSILASVSHVCLGALRCAWNAKWNLGMKIRPEVYAQRLDLVEEVGFDSSKVPGLDTMYSLLRSNMKTEIKNKNNSKSGNSNLYLLMQYPEGSPVHPSHPAGHAVVAGAATTVIKAMFNCHENDDVTKKAWPVQAVHSLDGNSLIDYNEADNTNMTIIGEINKLASNVSLGRDFAAVHYRCDGDCGIMLGESFAISYLLDLAKEIHESQNGSFQGWLLEKFNGTRIKITYEGLITL